MLECEICCEMFERDKPAHFPKMLPCGHTMCARCIDRLISANQQITTFQCPMCKQSLSNPSHGAQLPTNYYIMGLLEENSKPASSNINANESCVDLMKITATCPKCLQKHEMEKCPECELLLCKKCLSVCTAAHLDDLRKKQTLVLKTFEQNNWIFMNKQYLAFLDTLISQNDTEANAIGDHIEAIEQRVKSEKAQLLDQLAKLKENNVAFVNFRPWAKAYFKAKSQWATVSYTNKNQLESAFKRFEEATLALTHMCEQMSRSTVKKISFQPHTFKKGVQLVGDAHIVDMNGDSCGGGGETRSTKLLISGSNDRKIKVWDIESAACVRTLEGHKNSVWALQLLASGGQRRLASASDDNTIRIWDMESGACLRTLTGHRSAVFTLQLLANGQLASGSHDDTIKVWEVESGKCLHTLEDHTDSVPVLQALVKKKLASGSHDNTIKI